MGAQWQVDVPLGFRFVDTRKGESANWLVGEGKLASDTGDKLWWVGVRIG